MLLPLLFSALLAAVCHLGSAESEYSDIVKRSSARNEPLFPRRYRPYQTVAIDDPAQNSSGIYFRISQRGVDYLSELITDGLPQILERLVLPTISGGPVTLKDAVITQLDRPGIGMKFVKGVGVDISVRLSALQLSGDTSLSVLFVTYQAQMLASVNNLTVNMRVAIHRNLNETSTKVTVNRCSVSPGILKLQYFGPDASEFNAIGNVIQSAIDGAIRDKICELPPLLNMFLSETIEKVMSPPSDEDYERRRKRFASAEDDSEDEPPPFSTSVVDHLCGHGPEALAQAQFPDNEDYPEVDLTGEFAGTWMPDLSLRYPPTFSDKDLIFGIDGGIVVDGVHAPPSIQRPKFGNVTVIRDQMLGLIVSDYLPNTFFYQVYERKFGSVSVTYSLKHIPQVLRSLAKFVCSDCKLTVTANLTKSPRATFDHNGIGLLLEGDVSAVFHRKNQSYDVLTASGEIRVVINPHFRHSRLYSDVLLGGVDLKVYKAGMRGIVAGGVRKILMFLIPRAIWPKIQHRLRLAINYKGFQAPRICTLEFHHLHLDYMQHAAIISSDFNVDLPLLVRSFRQFMHENVRRINTRKELERGFRYL